MCRRRAVTLQACRGVIHLHQPQQHRRHRLTARLQALPVALPARLAQGAVGLPGQCLPVAPRVPVPAAVLDLRVLGAAQDLPTQAREAVQRRIGQCLHGLIQRGVGRGGGLLQRACAQEAIGCCPWRIRGRLAQSGAAAAGNAAAQPHHLVQRLGRTLITRIAGGLQVQVAVMAQAVRLQYLGLPEAFRGCNGGRLLQSLDALA